MKKLTFAHSRKVENWDIITPHVHGIIGFIRPEGVLMLPEEPWTEDRMLEP